MICVGIFFWGLNGYMKFAVAPGEAMEIQVTGQAMAVDIRVSGRIADRQRHSSSGG